MPGRPFNFVSRLPRQWPGRVRTATIHAISLAQLALTAARASAHSRRTRSRQERNAERLRERTELLHGQFHRAGVRIGRAGQVQVDGRGSEHGVEREQDGDCEGSEMRHGLFLPF